MAKFRGKIKMPKSGTKIVLFGNFWAGIWKQYCHNWNHYPRICQIAKSLLKMKISKFGNKRALFFYFGARILKNYCHIWNQPPRICEIAKFCEKEICLNLGPKMPYLSIFMLEFYQHLQICQTVNFLWKTENA